MIRNASSYCLDFKMISHSSKCLKKQRSGFWKFLSNQDSSFSLDWFIDWSIIHIFSHERSLLVSFFFPSSGWFGLVQNLFPQNMDISLHSGWSLLVQTVSSQFQMVFPTSGWYPPRFRMSFPGYKWFLLIQNSFIEFRISLRCSGRSRMFNPGSRWFLLNQGGFF